MRSVVRGAWWERWLVVPGCEIDLWVGRAAGFTEGVGEPEGAFAEPVAEHGDITAVEVDNAPLGGDEPCP